MVLDEAQMVGTGLGSVAVMAARLHSSHRWAVTGTPIGPGGLDDIQGLLKVLHHDPFCDPLKWKWCVANPYLTGAARPPNSHTALQTWCNPPPAFCRLTKFEFRIEPWLREFSQRMR